MPHESDISRDNPAEVDLTELAEALEEKSRELEEAAGEIAPERDGSKEERDARENEALDQALKAPLETLRRVAKHS